MKKTVLLAIPFVVVGLAALTPLVRSNSAAATGSQQGTEVPSPRSWIAFQAEWEKTKPGGATVKGRFYRNSDGSTRSESQFEGQSESLVAISNVGNNAYYERSVDGQWCSHPMRIDRAVYSPQRMRSNANVTLTKLPEKVEGFEVYHLTGVSRIIEDVVPELNFFAVVSQDPQTLTVQRYFNISVGPQDGQLFMPSAGTDVIHHTNLMGIVRVYPGQPEPSMNDLQIHK